MAITVELQYGVVFGKCDASDWIEWEIDLDGEAEEAYLKAKKLRIAFDEFPELEAVLSAAYEEIEEQENFRIQILDVKGSTYTARVFSKLTIFKCKLFFQDGKLMSKQKE